MSGPPVLPGQRKGHNPPPEIAQRRAAMAQALQGGAWATQTPPREESMGGVPVLRWQPQGPPRGRVIHFHGGGYRMGCPEMEGPFALSLAQACAIEVIAPRYRLAPEHPFPAAISDGLAVLRALPADLPTILSGGSAGGGLAAALALLAGDEGAAVAGLMLHSAWLDLTVSAPSYATNGASDPLFSHAAASQAATLYLQGHDPRDPLASPLLGALADLPPCLITVGSGEVLRDDSTRFAAALKGAGVPARLCMVPGMDHVAITRTKDAPGAAECFAATITFINEVLAFAVSL